MSIEAINEQLLRAIGVGVALLDLSTLRLRFHNDTFAEWFGVPEPNQQLAELFPEFDVAALRAGLTENGRHHAETTFRLRRRTMTVALSFNEALDGDTRIAVLVCQNITRIKELESMIDSYSMMVERNTREIKREKEQVEKLLLNMMPRSVYEEFKTFGVVTPRLYEPVSVLCLDFSGFSEIVTSLEPGVVVTELNDIYSSFDRIGDQFGCERIKTVGDMYITVSGMPDPSTDHAQSVANAAVRFVRYLDQRNASRQTQWNCRIGLAAGSVIGSVVGVQKYLYDVFGPAVSQAMQLRQIARPMKIVGNAQILAGLQRGFVTEAVGTLDLGNAAPEDVYRIDAEARPAQAGI